MTDMQYEPPVGPPDFNFPAWRPLPGYEQAACKDKNVEEFHPTSNAGIRDAKMVCFWCPLGKNGGVDGPLVDSCLEYALDLEGDGSTLDMRAGIWGGSGPQDRANLDKGLMTAEDLFGMCAYEDCDEPIPKAGNKRLYCSWKCGYLARRAEKAA